MHVSQQWQSVLRTLIYLGLLCLSACGTRLQSAQQVPTSPAPQVTRTALQVPAHKTTPVPTPGTLPTSHISSPVPFLTPSPTPVISSPQNPNRPLLAFYYTWYDPSTWCTCTMSDLPATKYNSDDATTIDHQVNWAAQAGITGFISSWWGIDSRTDKNFAKLLAQAATLESQTHYHFASTIYFESDAPALSGTNNIVNALRYVIKQYSNDPHFLRWQDKPVLFFWHPIANGRTLDQWASIRKQVDPNNQMIWSAEGTNTDVLNVFDGIHLFSAGYWGIQNGNIDEVDQGFRAKIDVYNQTHNTHKVWAAGVLPGYDDTRVAGRQGTYVIPRNNGATYNTSWKAALGNKPEWITITSFNEWFEGSMIEPSTNYGMQYLQLTQQYAKQWHG